MADRQGWHVALSLALVGIVGAWLGSAVQHFLSLERERSNAFEERQSTAYVAFLNAFEKYRVSSEAAKAGNTEKAAALEAEFQLEAGAARRRIAVFGDRQVVEAMANWYRAYGQSDHPRCNEQLTAELALWQQMRNAVLGGDQTASLNDLAAITTGCKPALGQ